MTPESGTYHSCFPECTACKIERLERDSRMLRVIRQHGCADAIRAATLAAREDIIAYCDALIDEAEINQDDSGETVAMIIKAAVKARIAQDEGKY